MPLRKAHLVSSQVCVTGHLLLWLSCFAACMGKEIMRYAASA